jgi:hypothetical protein
MKYLGLNMTKCEICNLETPLVSQKEIKEDKNK